MSEEWMSTLEGEDEPAKVEAALHLLRVNHAALTMENARLATMRDALIANEAELISGTEGLKGALQDLTNVTSIFEMITGVLSSVGKIITIL
jgi:hypothetical protein